MLFDPSDEICTYDSPEPAADLHRQIAELTAQNAALRAQLDAPNLRERLADTQHAIWAHWMRYMFYKCVKNDDGSVTILAPLVERWSRQMDAPYSSLTDKERESDREQADKVIAALAPEAH